MNKSLSQGKSGQRRSNLGLICTVALGTAYGGFVVLSAFAPTLMADTVSEGSMVTWAFVYGLAVIALGAVLTFTYAAIANAREDNLSQSKITQGADR